MATEDSSTTPPKLKPSGMASAYPEMLPHEDGLFTELTELGGHACSPAEGLLASYAATLIPIGGIAFIGELTLSIWISHVQCGVLESGDVLSEFTIENPVGGEDSRVQPVPVP